MKSKRKSRRINSYTIPKTVKQSEVDLNADYKKHIINLETRIIALGKLNNEFVDKITELKDIIARLTR